MNVRAVEDNFGGFFAGCIMITNVSSCDGRWFAWVGDNPLAWLPSFPSQNAALLYLERSVPFDGDDLAGAALFKKLGGEWSK